MKTLRTCVTALLTGLGIAAPVVADETEIADRLSIELNAIETQDTSCVLSFLAQNGHGSDMTSVVFEAVLFDEAGQVDRLTLFDFGRLPAARPRVRQFVVPELTCDGLSRIIFNGVSSCTGDGLTAAQCETGLMLNTRTDIEMQG